MGANEIFDSSCTGNEESSSEKKDTDLFKLYGVAYAVNHFQRRKKRCIASTVTELTSFVFA